MNTLTWPADGYGSLVVEGDLTVKGCILWQQDIGLFQNTCTVYEDIFKDCVHGVVDRFNTVNPVSCKCEKHWMGPLCNIHDCFGRGLYEITTGICDCKVANYTVESFCALKTSSEPLCTVDGPDGPEGPECHGQCVNNKCQCTLAGQLGQRCLQCAYPLVDEKLCPKRTNWGRDYINLEDGFGVCGGGYEFSSADIVILRALVCRDLQCKDFRDQRVRCCNPIAASLTLCENWQSWTYNRVDFPTSGVVFHDMYRARYLQILLDHNGTGCDGDCFQRSYNVIQSSDWPLLEVDAKPNRGYVIYGNGQSMGLEIVKNAKVVSAVWSAVSNTTVYLKGSGTYVNGIYEGTDFIPPSQLQMIMYYSYPMTFCLAAVNTATWSQLVLYGKSTPETSSQMYWVNLMDQPGVAFDPIDYCGFFRIEGNKFFRREEGLAKYPGSRASYGYWWDQEQGVEIV